MAFTTIKKPSDYFNTLDYNGNGSNRSIIDVGFQPDMVWLKSRSFVQNHEMYDAVRTATKRIYPNGTFAEDTNSTGLTSFDSDGFSLGSSNTINQSGDTFVSWNWKANGAGSSNTDGSITSSVSANTTSGFSIVSYTGNGSAGATIGHGLGAVPAQIIVKATSQAESWEVYNKNLDPSNGSYMRWNSTQASAGSSFWNNTSPTSSVFTVNSADSVNGSGITYIAYCFAEKTGYSKFGSYTGNGNANGTFVYTGFKPAFVIFKNRATAGTDWDIFDTSRDAHNVAFKELQVSSNSVESSSTVLSLDILSNGFKLRTSNANANESGIPFIYMAFAEEPLVGDNPATAR